MILNDSQVKLIADRGRALPDAVLAPLVLSLVLGAAPAQPQQPTAPTPRRQGRGFVGGPAKRVEAVVEYVTGHPGASFFDIVGHLACTRSVVQNAVARALQDGRIERRSDERDGRKRYVYHPRAAAPATEPKPAVLLTEQRFDGANHQRLVKVERRRDLRKAMPSETQRINIVVDYIRQHPGAQMGEISEHLGYSKETARRAVVDARREGRIRMEGTLGRARYFARTIVNGGNIENIDAAFRPRTVANA